MPAAGGIYSFTVTASNATGSTSQSFTLTVNQAPSITTGTSATFTVGSAGAFSVTAKGFPAPAVTESGNLPNGVTFNAVTGTLSGTPTAGGAFPISFSASNIAGSLTQNFTLTVNQAPAITSANSASFTVGVPGSFTVTAGGFPVPSLVETGALPSGISFVDNHNGTGALVGTAVTSGTFTISFAASNGIGIGSAATQSFTLTVAAGGGGAGLTITPTSINFGTLHLLHFGANQVTLQNNTTAQVNISNISMTMGPRTLFDDFFFLSGCKSSLAPAKSCEIAVFYFADDLGTHTATLQIKDSASKTPQTILLTGTAIK
jgi:hypothetical protein